MISGWPVFWVLLLAATGAVLVAATTTTTSADSGASGAAASAAGAHDRELAAAAAVFESDSSPPLENDAIVELVDAGGDGGGGGEGGNEERRKGEGDRRAQEVEKEPKVFKVPIRAGSEAKSSGDGDSSREIQSIKPIVVGRLQSREATGSSSNLERQQQENSEFPRPLAQDIGQLPSAAAIITSAAAAEAPSNSSFKAAPVYTNQFVIQVKGGEVEARKLAAKYGFVYLNHILGDYYHLEHRRLSKRSTSPHHDALNISIQEEPQVLLLERQVLKRRVKRDFLEFTTAAASYQPEGGGRPHQMHPVLRPANQPHQQRPPGQQQQQLRPNYAAAGQRRPAAPTAQHAYTRPANQPRGPQPVLRLGPLLPQPLAGARISASHEPAAAAGGRTQEMLEAAASSASLLYHQASALAGAGPKQPGGVARAQSPTSNNNLHIANSTASIGGQQQRDSSNNGSANSNGKQMPFNDPSWPLMWYLDGGAKNGFDLNVMAAWKMGYTGKGIVITILDDGLEKDHPDLQANYDPLASFDINGDDADPMPRYDSNDSNRHGTRCAGEVAAVPDNNICSIGIAYNSKVGGVRMLDGDVTDAVEARSLGLNNQHIHIYSASWGPDDNGKTVDGPGEMATRAFIEGVTNGRQGLGSIFVFASGNGGREHDNCNCDGYTNSIWTLSISSATENGYVPWYIEACSSTLATTYSSGSYEERQIATTDLHHSCTSSHTGTSASAPLAAGICALVLESNPRLTWRDMQHIVVRTAKPANLVAKDWRTNSLRRNVSHAFGYGLMDAAAMIIMAKHWTTVPIQYTCEVRSPPMDKFIPAKGYIELKLRAECANVRYLEHVQSKVTLTASRRGDLHIYLISPHGTRSTLLAQRPNDQAEQGFRNWPFMTVHSWGESPNGIWTLEVHNDGKPQNRAYLKEWTLILYGTSEDPNKHLDSVALTQAAMAAQAAGSLPPPAQPKPTTTTPSTLPPLAPPASESPPPPPAISSNPPGPLSPTPYHGQYPSVELEPAPVRPTSHWTFSSPPPPPPVSAPGRPPSVATAQPESAPPASSTPASYVTTFKTIVNEGKAPMLYGAPMAGRVQHPPPPPAPTLDGGNNVGGHVGHQQTTKADFEIVSPAATQAPPASNQNISSMATPTSGPILDASGGITKPSVSQLDNGQHAPPPGPINQAKSPTTNEPPTTHPPGGIGPSANNELDGNQIDSKLTKDYRSSGDQSVYAPNQNDRLGADSGGRPQSGASDHQPPGSAAGAASDALNPLVSWACPLVTLLMLIISSNHRYHQLQTNTLVRLENVRPLA